MNDYSALIQQILNVPLLDKQVKAFAEKEDALNLVTDNWKEQLQNHKPFQEFQQNARNMFLPVRENMNSVFRVQNICEHVEPLKVIVAGVCKMYKPYDKTSKQGLSIIMSESPVMDMLTKAITSDVDSKRIHLNPTCKINFGTCAMFCKYCSSARENMVTNRVRVNCRGRQPCILDISVFDGKSIANRFGSQILEFFPGSFIAIVKMELNVRYFYTNNTTKEEKKDIVRVGGSVLKMVCFPESNLKEHKVELGDLNALADVDVGEEDSSFTEECEVFGKKRPFVEKDNDSITDDEDDVIDALPSEKKQKTWEDNFDVLEDTILLE